MLAVSHSVTNAKFVTNDAFSITKQHAEHSTTYSVCCDILWDMWCKQRPPSDVQERGAWAERKAARYLQRRAWRLCARNWIGGGGELDLVMSRWKTLLIVEVRFRGDDEPFVSIDEEKIKHLQLASKALVRQHKLHQYQIRFDAIGVLRSGELEWRKHIIKLQKTCA